MDKLVLDQYEAYPYPTRDPGDERKRLITGSPSHLLEINHYVFAGRRDFSKPFRALSAGGGTGDSTIMMAQQLADTGGPGEVIYLDISRAARGIAEARARERGLHNVRFLTGSLLDLPGLSLGRFDYVDCVGVLHHLEDPTEGLRTLAEALTDEGGIGLMVYGVYGRTGVYPAQAMLRMLGQGLPLAERVPLARRLLGALPQTNWLRKNPVVGDHRTGSDSELVDLLLHERDRPCKVPEVMELLSRAGLRIASFIEPARYDPATYLNDPVLLRRLEALSPWERAAFAECLAGNMKKHIVYAVLADNRASTVASPAGPDTVPVLRDSPPEALATTVQKALEIQVRLDDLPVRFALPRLAPPIIARVDGRSTLGEIHGAILSLDSAIDWDRFKVQFDRLYRVLNGINAMLLINPDHKGKAAVR